MKYELKRIPVFPVIKVTFLVSLVLGFAVGLLAAMFIVPLVAMMSRMGQAGDGLSSSGFPVGVLVFILPFFYAVLLAAMNTLMMLIATGAYNVIVKFAGGIELELESTEPEMRMPQPPAQPVYYAQVPSAPYMQPVSRPAPPPPPPPPPLPPNNPEADKNSPTQFPFE